MERLTEKIIDENTNEILAYRVKGQNNIFAIQKLGELEEIEEQGRLVKLPCKVGDFVLFSTGSIKPVVYITVSNKNQIMVGCQNGHIINLEEDGKWYKGFFESYKEAKLALEKMDKAKK